MRGYKVTEKFEKRDKRQEMRHRGRVIQKLYFNLRKHRLILVRSPFIKALKCCQIREKSRFSDKE